MTLLIELPWPSTKLRPNARVHWAVRSRETKSHRRASYFITLAAARNIHPSVFPPTIPVRVTFHPPDDHRDRDRDGMISSCKAYFDGVADGLGVDDNRFDLRPFVGDRVKGGKVLVEIEACATCPASLCAPPSN